MDPLSITASILALISTTRKVIGYMSDVKDTSKEKLALTEEFKNLLDLFLRLNNLAEEAKKNQDLPWFDGVRMLGGEKGPLELFKKALDVLANKLKSSSSAIKGAARSLLWTLDKAEIANTLERMERLKSHIHMALDGDHFELSRAIQDDVRELLAGNRESRSEYSYEHQREILGWLSPLDFSTTQKDKFQQREPGTGTWLLGSQQFHDWHNGIGKVLWCPGIPGAGKTVLASVVMNHLQTTTAKERVAALCIYFNHKEEASQTAVHLLSSLLRQVVERCSDVSKAVTNFRRDHKTTRPTFDQLKSAFETEIEPYEKIFVIIDALDECADEKIQRVLLDALKSPAISIMVTTRHSVKAEKFFNGVLFEPYVVGVIHLDILAEDSDVQKYIESRIANESRLARQVGRNSALRGEILEKVTKSSKGMFLCARLHMESLATKSKVRDVKKMLNCLPETLPNIYEEAVKRIRTQCVDDSNLAERVIYWVTHSYRPLSLKELQCALAIEPGMTELGEDDLDDEESLVSVCAGLVVVDGKRSLVRLVHFTAQDYFKKTHQFHLPVGLISTGCLTYLSFDIFSEICEPLRWYRQNFIEGRDEEPWTLTKTSFDSYSFANYSMDHWHKHVRGEEDEKVLNLATAFLSNKSKSKGFFYRYWYNLQSRELQGIHLAVLLNFEKITNIILEQPLDIDLKDDQGFTPLHWAVRQRHDDMVRLLIGKGADPNSKNNKGEGPLSVAAKRGYTTIVEILIGKGADPNSKDNEGKGPLSAAAEEGYTTIVEILIASGADVNAQYEYVSGRTLLFEAFLMGNEIIPKLLVANGADLDSEIAENGQELLLFILCVRLECAQTENLLRLLVIEKKMNVNLTDRRGVTPLRLAVANGDTRITKFLIEECGANLDPLDEQGRTPLAMAALVGNEWIVKFLIEKGAELNTEDNEHRTPLMWARLRARIPTVVGGEETVKMMIDNGADPKVEDVLNREDLDMAFRMAGLPVGKYRKALLCDY